MVTSYYIHKFHIKPVTKNKLGAIFHTTGVILGRVNIAKCANQQEKLQQKNDISRKKQSSWMRNINICRMRKENAILTTKTTILPSCEVQSFQTGAGGSEKEIQKNSK